MCSKNFWRKRRSHLLALLGHVCGEIDLVFPETKLEIEASQRNIRPETTFTMALAPASLSYPVSLEEEEAAAAAATTNPHILLSRMDPLVPHTTTTRKRKRKKDPV